MTARELVAVRHEPIRIPSHPALVLARGALVVFVGPRGAGKSTMVASMLASLGQPTLLLSIEELPGASLAWRLVRVGADHDRMLVVSDISVEQTAALIERHQVVAVGVDSQQRSAFSPKDLRDLLRTSPSLRVALVVSQVNQTGDVRGGQDLAHECDVLVRVEGMRWGVTKSRYQKADGVGGEVMPKPRQEE